MKTLNEQLKSSQRELALRRSVYPKWVREQRKTQTDATHEIECMEAISETLRKMAYLEEISNLMKGTENGN